jgi:photosystem II stability/assembly factor-like uncharacterized protein
VRSRQRMLVSLVATAALVTAGGLFATTNGGADPTADATAGAGAEAVADDRADTPNPLGMAEWMYQQRIYPERAIPYDAAAEAIALSAQMDEEELARTGGASAARWKLTGPSNIGGRIVELAPDPTEEGVVYAAAGTGGIWKTTNSGQTFESVWPNSSVQSMGAVFVGQDGVVWAGTGEPDMGGGSAFYGDGVYRSDDDGATWEHVGLANSGSIGAITVDPTDADRIFVTAQGRLHDTDGQRGVFRSEDGGATWVAVLQPSDPGKESIGGIDIAINPNNPDIVLATTWDKIRAQDGRIYGKGSKLYRSTDGGDTWTDEQEPPLPISYDSESEPITQTYVGRMGIAFAPSESGRAYLISTTAGGNFNGFFTSTNSGRDWTAVGATSGGVLQQITGGFGWWFGEVWVDPENEDHVFLAGVNMAESLNGGVSWTLLTATHVDHHGLAWDPFVEDRVYNGNDGGFYRNDDNGGTATPWFKTAKMPITQFYAMDSSEQNVERLNAGSQDNNSLKSWQSDGSVTGEWVAYVGGDGMMNRIDPENQNYYYGCSQNGGCRAFTPVGSPAITIPGARKNWVAPLEFRGSDTKTLYGASEYMNRLEARTGGFVWEQISDDLTGGPTPRSAGYGTITAIGSGYDLPGLVYAGTDDGRLWRSKNADAADPDDVTWKRLKDDALPKRWVTRVEVSPTRDNWTAASFSAWRWLDGEDSPHVVLTKDKGKSWKDISGNLPDAPVNDVMWHPTDEKTLFVGTDVGVFTTTDLGGTWTKVGSNLPLVPVLDVNIQAESQTLFVATYGRSVWQTSIAP